MTNMYRSMLPAERVKVYRNLHKKCLSVMGADGLVIGHVDTVVLKDVKFVVRPAGQRKVRQTGRKNVHAFAVGEVISFVDHHRIFRTGKQVLYNPYLYDTFVEQKGGNPIHTASMAEIDATRGIWIL